MRLIFYNLFFEKERSDLTASHLQMIVTSVLLQFIKRY